MRARRLSVLAAAVLALSTGAARSEQPPPASYGSQTGALDLAAILTVGIGAATQVPLIAALGGATYLLGGPVTHWAHGHIGRGFGSLGLRIALPVAFGYLGGVFGSGISCSAEDCRFYNALGGSALGIAVGATGAMLLDGLWLAHEPEPKPEQRVTIVLYRRTLALRTKF